MGKIESRMFWITGNHRIARDIYEMTLNGDTTELEQPGIFVNIKIEGCFLRRPISICSQKPGELTLVYKVAGKGTDALSRMKTGQELDLLCPLGNGFDMTAAGNAADTGGIVLVGGGVGVPPLYGLARRLQEQGCHPEVILGFGSAEEVFYLAEFRQLGLSVTVATMDGSLGICGNVLTAAGNRRWKLLYACGPEPMLFGIKDLAEEGQFSFESRMGCGFGACMGCSCETLAGPKRICKEGPVMKKEEILWPTQE